MNTKATITYICLGGLIGCALIGAIYGLFWVVKTTNYSLFYESKVKATITEMVKPEALRK